MIFKAFAPLAVLLSFSVAASAVGVLTGQIKNLVTFGDSFSSLSPTGDRETAWPVYAANYGSLNLYGYAQSGATCSNNIVPVPYPSVMENQFSTYLADMANGTFDVNQNETLYLLWIGANDVGPGGFTTGDQWPGMTLVDFVGCVLEWVKQLYAYGGRNFIVMDLFPMETNQLYSKTSYPNTYCFLERNTTAWHVQMVELVAAINALEEALLTLLAPTLPDSHVGFFDTYSFFTHVTANPQDFFNGTVPLNMTGSINHCVYQIDNATSGVCNIEPEGPAWDSYLMYDELHPSAQSNRVLARAISNAIGGVSGDWISWLS